MRSQLIQAAYLASSVLFIFSLYWMNHPRTARRGVFAGVAGMTLAILGTLLQPGISNWGLIGGAVALGFLVGIPLSWVPLTAVPQRTALSHAFGGLAAGLVGIAKYYLTLGEHPANLTPFLMTAIIVEVILGFLTFTGSLMAAGKLQEIRWIPQRPVTYSGQNAVNLALLGIAVLAGIGLILSIIMCKAMNRSFTNVLFGAFGQVQAKAAAGEAKTAKVETPEGAAQILEEAQLVVIVPGYGMAVAQAQHRVRELYDQLTKRGVDVRFAIHPVAGRMPGHMNVLLAEADIPYDKLVEMDDMNPDMPQVDVVLVIGANDVVNPAARHDKASPIYGMPIIDADKARMCFAIKRSMNPGFAGIENELYFADHTYMLFGDAKAVVGEIVKELSGQGGH